MKTILEVKNLTKKFVNNKKIITAVNNISFSIKQGEIVSFLGPNGAGKTTTIKIILDLISKDDGEIFFLDRKLNNNVSDLLRNTGIVLEGTRNIYWNLSPIENFAYWGRCRGISKRKAINSGIELLAKFGLVGKKDVPVKDLSLGMQQIVSVCCAVLTSPQLLLLDEPTLGLDIKTIKKMEAFLKELARDKKTGILITTHQLEFAQTISDSILLINEGKIIYTNNIRQALDKFNSRKQYAVDFERCLTNEEYECLKKIGQIEQLSDKKYLVNINTGEKLRFLLASLSKMPILEIKVRTKKLEDIFMEYIR
ncbi:ABC transporter ATP-binding protein [Lactobacillus johnsonii]